MHFGLLTMRHFRNFSWKDSHLRICSPGFDLISRAAVAQRSLLEAYILRHPEFRTALTPLPLLAEAPEIARAMARAADLTGVGPMAAVAGAIAESAARAALRETTSEAIVENGGDIFLASAREIVVGVYSGRTRLGVNLAFRVAPAQMPLAICSSSSRMGHSLSFGQCELATVVATDGALADAAATLACNLVKTEADIEPTLERVGRIPGIMGLLVVKDDRVGLIGDLPPLVRNADPELLAKITRDPDAKVL